MLMIRTVFVLSLYVGFALDLKGIADYQCGGIFHSQQWVGGARGSSCATEDTLSRVWKRSQYPVYYHRLLSVPTDCAPLKGSGHPRSQFETDIRERPCTMKEKKCFAGTFIFISQLIIFHNVGCF